MSLELDRRSFLVGLFGTAVVAAAGPLPKLVEPIDLEAWAKAVSKVYGNYISDCLIYGSAGIRYIERFPYIENVPIEQLTLAQISLSASEILPYTSELSDARRRVSDRLGSIVLEQAEANAKARRHQEGEDV